MRFTSISNKGSQDINQDVFARICRNDIYCFAMADGGGIGGEEAAKVVVNSIIKEFESEPILTKEKAVDCIEFAKSELKKFIKKDNFYKSAYVSASVLLVDGKNAITAHIGDVRIYELEKGHISSITDDHTEAVEQYKAGKIQFDEIRTYKKNKYTKIINLKYNFEPECNEYKIKQKTSFLMCTSGFWRKITEPQIEASYANDFSSKEWMANMLHHIEENLGAECFNMTALTVVM